MKNTIIYFLLVWITMAASFATTRLDSRFLEGIWYDYTTDTYLEIKDHRKGIKAREIYQNRKRSWDTYFKMGRDVFDNCDGRAIIALNQNQIQWKIGRRGRGIILERANRGRDRRSDRYRNDRYQDRSFSYNRSSRSTNSGELYIGDWYCSDHRLYLEIKQYGNGFRARRPNQDWVYYERDEYNNYRDNRGNRYFFDNGELNWESRDRRDQYRFSKR